MAAPADILSGLPFPTIGGGSTASPGVTSNALSGFDLSSFGGGATGIGGSSMMGAGGSTPVLDAFGNPTTGGSGSGLPGGITLAGFDPFGAANEGTGMMAPGSPSLTPDAQANGVGQSASPMSQLFGAVGNLFQRAGLIVLGVVLIGIGAYFLARPALERAGAKVAKVAAAV